MNKKNNKGISLAEVLIVISIIGVIAAITFPSLSRFRNQQVLRNTAEDVVSLLNEARNNTISSKNSTTYGIHFETDKITLFAGTTFTESPDNKIVDIDDVATISVINLTGGDDVVFNRITGDTQNDGTITIELSSDASQQKIITISKIGIISVN